MHSTTTIVGPVHWEDFSGMQFERIVFAYHARVDSWRTLEWYGLGGKDRGRDIWGIRENDSLAGEKVCVLCANWGVLTSTKAIGDIKKFLKAPTGKPDRVRVVTRSAVSANVRDKIREFAQKEGISICEVWTGTEFEEFLRRDCEVLLLRFTQGVEFPDIPPEIIDFARSQKPLSERESLALLARAFNRPAFKVPFYRESSLPAFTKAIDDTIQAISTGLWQTREGKELGRLPSIKDFKGSAKRKLEAIVGQLDRLRSRYNELVEAQEIRACTCDVPSCSVVMMSEIATKEMDLLRTKLLNDYRSIYPAFDVRIDSD
jgi:hypothetical protein